MINVLSPYYLNYNDTDLSLINVDLYIYTGTQTTDRGAIKYNIQKKPYNNLVSIEISSLVKDYLTTDLNNQSAWVDIITTKYISDVAQTPITEQHAAFYGYGYFQDGINPQQVNTTMISNNLIINYTGSEVKIPVNATETSTLQYYNGNTLVSTVTINPVTLSDDIINYSTSLSTYDRVLINGNEIKIKDIDECTDIPYKVTFINKFGALQEIWFFKRKKLTLNTTKESYKANIVNKGSYSKFEHQTKITNKQGREKISLNTGYYPQQYNEIFKQISLSEYIWVEIDGANKPIKITSSSLNYKTQLTDKLINYTIEIEMAFDKINNIT